MTKITLEFKEDKEFIRKWLVALYLAGLLNSELRQGVLLREVHSIKQDITKERNDFGEKFFEQLEKELELREE